MKCSFRALPAMYKQYSTLREINQFLISVSYTLKQCERKASTSHNQFEINWVCAYQMSFLVKNKILV